MGVLVAVWISNLKIGVVFQPITLVDSIVFYLQGVRHKIGIESVHPEKMQDELEQ